MNAMLHGKILPSGVGHTTNCFCCLQGTDRDTPFLTTQDAPTEEKSIESIKHLAHALFPENGRLSADAIVKLYWPRARCELLTADVQLVDSPGLDISENFDEYIDKYCSDADVFVLVANSEVSEVF